MTSVALLQKQRQINCIPRESPEALLNGHLVSKLTLGRETSLRRTEQLNIIKVLQLHLSLKKGHNVACVPLLLLE